MTEDVFVSAPIPRLLMEQRAMEQRAVAWCTENLFPPVAGKLWKCVQGGNGSSGRTNIQ